MGRAAAFDLLHQNDTENVIIADKDEDKLSETKEFLNAVCKDAINRTSTIILDINNLKKLEEIFSNVNAAISAIHYKYNEMLTKIVIKTKTHLCDLGGNNTVVDAQLQLNNEAIKAGVSIIPDCGLAPGMVSILVKWGIEKFNWVDTVEIRVGGLPQNPNNKLKYERLFSIDGLINEYTEPVRVLQDGEVKEIEPLTEVEKIDYVGAFCKMPLEAFTTSGGTSTLITTYKNKLKNLDYKTIRYKGHCEGIKNLQRSGLFTHEYFEKNLPIGKNDVTLVKIVFKGNSKKYELTIIDKAKPPFTSMMRMTAFPASIISRMQARGQIANLGVQPQENCVPTDEFISELAKRQIVVSSFL